MTGYVLPRWLVLFSFLLPCLIVGPAREGAAVDKGFERIEFDPPREANLRMKSGVAVRSCSLLGISRDKVTIETGSKGPRAKQTEIELSRVVSILTADKEFRYQAGDDFDRLMAYAQQLDGVKIGDARELFTKSSESLRNLYGVRGQADPTSSPPANVPPPGGFQSATGGTSRTPGGFSGQGGFGPSSGPPAPNQPPGAENTLTPAASADQESSAPTVKKSIQSLYGVDEPHETDDEILVCSNCRQDVTMSSIKDSRCPHCGILLVLGNAAPSNALALNNPPAADGAAAAAAPGDSAPGVAKAAGGPIQLPPPPPPTAPAGAAGPTDFDLKTMPLWMKAALFFGAVGIGYYLVLYRR